MCSSDLPAGEIIRQLCDNVSKNGNLLLNIGPDREGRFPEEAKRQLYKIGEWLRINGEAIYGTRPWRISSEGGGADSDHFYGREEAERELRGETVLLESRSAPEKGEYRFTQNGSYLYAIFFDWPEDGRIWSRELASLVSARPEDRSEIVLLGSRERISYSIVQERLCISLPEKKPCEDAWVIRVGIGPGI